MRCTRRSLGRPDRPLNDHAFCPQCGSARVAGAAFCGTCGRQWEAAKPSVIEGDLHEVVEGFWARQSAPKRFLLVAVGAIVGLVVVYLLTPGVWS